MLNTEGHREVTPIAQGLGLNIDKQSMQLWQRQVAHRLLIELLA